MKNLNNPLLIASLSLALLLPLSATANEFSIGIIGGKTDIDNNCDLSAIGLNNECTSDVSDSAIGINAGYAFNENVGVELGYVDLGGVRLDFGEQGNLFAEIDLSPTVIYAAAVGSISLNNRLSLSGRIGYYDLEADVFEGLYAVSVPQGFSADTLSDSDIYVGGSIDYSLTDAISAQLRYDDFDIGVYSLGLKYSF